MNTWRQNGLTDTEMRMLELEKGTYKNFGTKHQQVLSVLAMGPTEYYQKLNALIETDAAMRYDPLTVKRLLRLRDARRHQRSQSRLHAIESQ